MSNKPLFIVMILFVGLGCRKESISVDTAIQIDEELAPYFERFKEAGAERGVEVDFEKANLSAYLEDIAEPNVSGQCYDNAAEPDRLVIDSGFWRQASDIRREFVVFHELGHCFLHRGHLDAAGPDGACASIMHSGLSGCRNAYSSLTRSGYLDELFLEN